MPDLHNTMLHLHEEAAYCLLCSTQPCTKACPDGLDPARAIRAVRFANTNLAANFIDKEKCAACSGPCEDACIHYNPPIYIRNLINALPQAHAKEDELPSLKITFCGVECENPFFLGSSIVTANYEMCANAFRAGWGGVVFKTIGMTPCNEVSPRFAQVREHSPQFQGLKNLEQISEHTPEYNCNVIRQLKKDFPTKVVVASIMGNTDEEWATLARMVTDAGADIIECNFSCPQMARKGMGSDVGQNAELCRQYTHIVKSATTLPVMPKMTPNIMNIIEPAIACRRGGATAIAAINTIKCLTGINKNTFISYPAVSGKCAVSGYSGRAVAPIALKFIYDLATCPELRDVQLSGIGGIDTWSDALDFILLGCRNVQAVTSVMQFGNRIIEDMTLGLRLYLKEHGIPSLESIVGAALGNIVPAEDLDRSTVVYPQFHLDQCIGCGRCVISCRDGGHQALAIDDDLKLKFNGQKCVGCHLCALVCPVGAIGTNGKRVPKPKREQA